MKTFLSLLLSVAVTGSVLAGSFGPGPWADGAYYPGGLNGKYMGVVTGNNISGVLGFALVDGAPPFRVLDQQTAGGTEDGPVVLNNDTIRPDLLQNYFTIFVEGRTYSGLTTAGIDLDSKTVAGAMEGTAPPALLAAETAAADPATPRASDALSIINRGLSGGFTAKIKKKKAVFTFKGHGELSTPANNQSYRISAVPQAAAGVITNITVSGQYETDTTPFNISGIRTSLFSSNPAAQQDALDLNPTAGGGGN